MSVHLVDALEDALLELVQRCDAEVAQKAARHLGERGLHQVKPRAVLGRVDILEASWVFCQLQDAAAPTPAWVAGRICVNAQAMRWMELIDQAQ